MKRTIAILLLLLASSVLIQAQKRGVWASARERGLRGAVHTVESNCSDSSGNHETRFKYEFARDGSLTTITAPRFHRFDCILTLPTSYKITKRNSRGDATEYALFVGGELERKERNEIEYDDRGNWIKLATFVMRDYEMQGGAWKAGEWLSSSVCNRTIIYYP